VSECGSWFTQFHHPYKVWYPELRIYEEREGYNEDSKERLRSQEKEAILGYISTCINRDSGNWDMQKNRETPFPLFPSLYSSLWCGGEVGLSLGGLLPRDGLLLV